MMRSIVCATGGAYEFYDYPDWGDPTRQRTVQTTGPNGVSAAANLPLGEAVASYFDGFGRIYEKDTTAGEGKTIQQLNFETFGTGGHSVYYSRPAWAGANTFPPQDPANEWIVVNYDEAERPSYVQSYPGTKNGPTTVASYSYAPLSVTSTDLHNKSIVTTFDTRGRVASRQDGYGTWYYQYDGADRVESVIMPNSDQLTIGYDSWGRRRSMIDPYIGYNTYVLDDLGNRLQVTDGNNTTVTYGYDEIGRIKTKLDNKITSTYTYDRSTGDFTMGRLASVTESSSDVVVLTTSFKYDAAGHTAERTRTRDGINPLVVDYFWDFLGRLQGKVMNSTAVTYLYPDGRNLREVQVNGQTFAKFSDYDPNRLPQLRITPAAVSSMKHDARGVLTDLVTTSTTGTELQNVHLTNDISGYTWIVTDQRSDKTTSWQEQGGTVSMNTDESVSFSYDDDNRLHSATSPLWGTLTYNYDPQGNLLQKGNVSFTQSAKQVVATMGANTIATINLDAAGNRSTLDNAQGHWDYLYNNEHQLERADLTSTAGNVHVRFYNDYEGNRFSKLFGKPSGEGVLTFYNDGIEERISTKQRGAMSTTVHVNAPGIGTIATITTGSIPGEPDLGVPATGTTSWLGDTLTGPAIGTVFYFEDWLGNASVMTDSTGNLVGRIMYQPFGETTSTDLDPHSRVFSIGRDAATLKFKGKELDEETGLTYFGARYYDPGFGRFLTADSEIPGNGMRTQGFNRYAYVFNNPVILFDPDGHEPKLAALENHYYVGPGWWQNTYSHYVNVAADSRASAWERTNAVAGAALTLVPGAFEEVVHNVLNIPHDADMAAQLAARASLQTNTFAMVDDYSAAVADFSAAFNNSLVVTAPLAPHPPAATPQATVAPTIEVAPIARGAVPRTLTDAELAAVRGGMMSRKAALTRLEGLAGQVETHLNKLARDPASRAAGHWRSEIATWLRDMQKVLPALGKKTEAEWAAKIQGWEQLLRE
jgi:RHS repeat-associated protein